MKKLIEKLASKELSFGCRIEYKDGHKDVFVRIDDDKYIYTERDGHGFKEENAPFEILGHPIHKHRVEEFLSKESARIDKETFWKLTVLWRPYGLSKSLQQIEEERGYEEGCTGVYGGISRKFCAEVNTCPHKRLKDPTARKLSEFITSI